MEEIRIAVLGNVDSAKSTLISTITNKILDDGRGSARKKFLNMIMKWKVEEQVVYLLDIFV